MSSVGFEVALKSYRHKPTTFNRALMLFLDTDFLWYSLYSLYLTPGHPGQDPVAIHRETGLSKATITSVAAVSTLLNAHRVLSGRDAVVPSFTFDKYSVMFNIKIPF